MGEGRTGSLEAGGKVERRRRRRRRRGDVKALLGAAAGTVGLLSWFLLLRTCLRLFLQILIGR